MNDKERLLSYIKGDHKDWMGYAFTGCPRPYPFFIDPFTAAEIRHTTDCYTDWWGVPWRQSKEDPGAVPLNNEANAIIKDITEWQEFVQFPDLNEMDFEPTRQALANVNREETLVIFPGYYGPFERIHTLMPFDECLMAIYEEPEALSDLLGAIVDWRIQALEPIIDEFHPDIMHCHDDWGSDTGLFMEPGLFRKYFKPHYRRYYAFLKDKGVLVQHHNDGIGQGLETDMLDMNIDMWQGVIVSNDIMEMKKHTDGKLIYMGGLDQVKLDNPGISEEEIRAEVRRAIDTYGPGGCFLPCYPSALAINVPGQFIAMDEIDRYSEIWMEKNL